MRKLFLLPSSLLLLLCACGTLDVPAKEPTIYGGTWEYKLFDSKEVVRSGYIYFDQEQQEGGAILSGGTYRSHSGEAGGYAELFDGRSGGKDILDLKLHSGASPGSYVTIYATDTDAEINKGPGENPNFTGRAYLSNKQEELLAAYNFSMTHKDSD